MFILLPPSEAKAAPEWGEPLDLASLGFASLSGARQLVADALVALCEADPEKAAVTLRVPKSQFELVGRNVRLWSEPAARAELVYTGVVFDNLGLTSLSSSARHRAATGLAVTSSLFGLLRPADRIPAYRLSGAAALPGVGGVAALWREHLGVAAVEALGDGLLVDLRSSMYAAFWRPPAELAPQVATVRVLHEVNGQRKVVSHFNKATKGRIVRALLEEGAEPGTPAECAVALRDLGWTVESALPSRQGTRLDVIVTAL